MLKPKHIAIFDQAMADVVAMIPGALWSFYQKLTGEGFLPAQALALTQTWMECDMCLVGPEDGESETDTTNET